MKRVLWATLAVFMINSPAYCEETDKSAEQESTLEEIIAEHRKQAAEPLNERIDYISQNYSEKELKDLIINYEKMTRKVAQNKGIKYVPYDRKIDVNDPKKVKRFLKNRTDIIF